MSDGEDIERSTSNVQRSTPKSDFDLEERLLAFAAEIVRLGETLPNSRAGNHIAGQLLRCGTAPLPNHGEAQAAESRADFEHKMSICLKELRECRRWIRLILEVPLVSDPKPLHQSLHECEELIRIFFASLRTSRSKRRGPSGR